MLDTLITLGRWTVVVGAFVTVAASTVAGWMMGTARDTLLYGYEPTAGGSTTQVGWAILGLAAGLVVSGLVYGLSAAIYDIQISMRTLSRRGADGSATAAPMPDLRTEPRFRN